ncbi:magnesium transporter CorA family protein [Vaginisenegalia massiliensis]|uniref:magnesium transporter CorA family protein n=1 Tax=Vaginisenegalia massiliensis TaxID=2058294 RepID=UPI000F520C9D|nr:magnesium transporter CorA family protein [Vaginisenegalia massiliensis]
MYREITINEQCQWININSDISKHDSDIFERYDIDEDFLDYALDRNEQAHIDYDKETGTFLVIYNVLNRVKNDRHYETIPMTFIVQRNRLITISNQTNMYIVERLNRYIQTEEIETVFALLFDALFLVSESYFPVVEAISQERDQVNRLLREKTSKKNLLALSDLETGIVFLVAASTQNAVLLEQIKTQFFYRRLLDDEKDRLDDAIIEAKQLVQMTKLNSQIMQQLSGTYNNILNNELNDNMTILTLVSIFLMVPTIISGFFGMNVPLPLGKNPDGWWLTIVMVLIICLALGFVLRKFMKKR